MVTFPMIALPKSLLAWATPAFDEALKAELLALGAEALPLHAALARGNQVLDSGIAVMVLSTSATPQRLTVRVGVQFESVVAGCACENDPTPMSTLPEYCQAVVEIDRRTAAAVIRLADT